MKATHRHAAIGCIDHIVIVVADLEHGAGIYRRLGFTLSPKGVHSAAMGSANHTIMLQNDYFELLTVLTPTERNQRWSQALDLGGGAAGVALTTEDASAAHAHWRSQGLDPNEPIQFARKVVRADGGLLDARFEVVSLPEVPDAGVRIFVCSQPTREAVWLPELMQHPNTAHAIRRLTLACADPAAAARQWQRVIPDIAVLKTRTGFTLAAGPHLIDLITHDSARADFGCPMAAGQTRAIGIEFVVADLEACRSGLRLNEIAFAQRDASLTVPADAACQVQLTFTQP